MCPNRTRIIVPIPYKTRQDSRNTTQPSKNHRSLAIIRIAAAIIEIAMSPTKIVAMTLLRDSMTFTPLCKK
jgi:hypothetical protein